MPSEKSASLMQAVNCVVRRGDELIGENTDGKGFVESLRTRSRPRQRGKSVVMFGAGGAARAHRRRTGVGRRGQSHGGQSLWKPRRPGELVQLLAEKTPIKAELVSLGAKTSAFRPRPTSWSTPLPSGSIRMPMPDCSSTRARSSTADDRGRRDSQPTANAVGASEGQDAWLYGH